MSHDVLVWKVVFRMSPADMSKRCHSVSVKVVVSNVTVLTSHMLILNRWFSVSWKRRCRDF